MVRVSIRAESVSVSNNFTLELGDGAIHRLDGMNTVVVVSIIVVAVVELIIWNSRSSGLNDDVMRSLDGMNRVEIKVVIFIVDAVAISGLYCRSSSKYMNGVNSTLIMPCSRSCD